MKNYLLPILIVLLCSLCERSEDTEVKPVYDLFPLNVGNEYYYSYAYYEKTVAENADNTIARIKWTIQSKNVIGETNEYNLQFIYYNIVKYDAASFPEVPDPLTDTVLVEDFAGSFKIIENKSGELSFENFLFPSDFIFQRYLYVPDTMVTISSGLDDWNFSLDFAVDTGLTRIIRSRKTAMHIWKETYSLDSINLN